MAVGGVSDGAGPAWQWQHSHLSPASDVPQPDVRFIPGGEALPIGRKGHRVRDRVLALEAPHVPLRHDIPQSHGLITALPGEGPAIGREADRSGPLTASRESGDLPWASSRQVQVPDSHGTFLVFDSEEP